MKRGERGYLLAETLDILGRGLGVEDMKVIAKLFGKVAKDYEGTANEVRATVAEICKKYPLYR